MVTAAITTDPHTPVTVEVATGDLATKINQTLAIPISVSMERLAATW